MRELVRLLAPAKLNLYLRVLGRRPDGYHELETLFERIDLADELTFEAQPHALRVICNDPSLPCDDTNLVLTAARLLQAATRTTQGATIHLTKRIPIAAGLGGGSSDAATTLVGLNRLWHLGWSTAQLRELACQVGSDVPFFLEEAVFAIGRGRGELLEPVRDGRALVHVFVTPNIRLSTKEIFSQAHFPLTAPWASISMVLHALRNGSLGELAKGLYNDLQPEAIRRCPVITEIQSRLRMAGCIGTLISGSGPTVFGLCQDATQAMAIAKQLRAIGSSDWRIGVVQTQAPRGQQPRAGSLR